MPVTVDRTLKKQATKIRSLERKIRNLEKQNEELVKHVTRLVSIVGENKRGTKKNRADLDRLLPLREPVQALVQSLKLQQKEKEISDWKACMTARLNRKTRPTKKRRSA